MIEKWLFSVALRKGALIAAKALAGFVLGAKVQPWLTQLGVHIDPSTLETGLGTLFTVGIEGAHDWLKLKGVVKV